ncbi:S16 family serine protease [Paenibacillus pinihumi]|uniref:S16 family serine protease n=1 Tax=Paenibacillus pinihumi TaxID=669462 RepID=UPI0004065921|nr:PDZ domain-containing protein [Paenibacillus pinihumi]
MARWQRWYGYGMAAAILLCITGELIWIPDVFHWGGIYWLDMLNWLVFLLLIPPLLWAAGAAAGLRWQLQQENAAGGAERTRRKWRRRTGIIRKGAILILSTVCILILLYMGIRRELSVMFLIVLAGLMIFVWLGAVWDVMCYEIRTRGAKFPWRGLTLFTVSAALLCGLFWPTAALVTYPGLTINMNRYVHVEGGQPKGEIMGLLVFDRPAFPADYLYAKLFPGYQFRPLESLGMSIGEYESLVRDLKTEADQLGSAIAFHEAGIGKGIVKNGAKVLLVDTSGPASGKLHPGDVIISVNDSPVTSMDGLKEQMAKVVPGEAVRIVILREEEKLPLQLYTIRDADDPQKAIMGIQAMDNLHLDLPLQVTFNAYFAHEGGPSHGAALALTLIDQLTPGGITNGHRVAVTGTIEADGAIGRIGGIQQKAFTAERAGADVFFVPAGQENDARKGAQKLEIVPVRTLDEIISWLRKRTV